MFFRTLLLTEDGGARADDDAVRRKHGARLPSQRAQRGEFARRSKKGEYLAVFVSSVESQGKKNEKNMKNERKKLWSRTSAPTADPLSTTAKMGLRVNFHEKKSCQQCRDRF